MLTSKLLQKSATKKIQKNKKQQQQKNAKTYETTVQLKRDF